MMRINSKVLKVLLLSACVMAPNFLHAQYPHQEPEIAEGVVRELNYESNVVVIDGFSYYVTADSPVEIRGTYGAFTMLKEGMNVSFSFYHVSDSMREIVKLTQLSDNRKMDQH